MILPIRYSPARIGVTNICSSIPDSRSFTTAWLRIAISEIIMMIAIRPGIIVFTGSIVGLNITRICGSTPGAATLTPCWAIRSVLNWAMIWDAYPEPTDDTCESEPSTMIPIGAVSPRVSRASVPAGMTSATVTVPRSSSGRRSSSLAGWLVIVK